MPELSALATALAGWLEPFCGGATWWLLHVWLAASVLAAAWRGREAWTEAGRHERAARGRETAVALALLAAALAARLLLAERVPYTYDDEYTYLAAARHLLKTHSLDYAFTPPLGVFLYALAFELARVVSSDVAFLATIALGSLTAPVLYGTLRAMRVPRGAAAAAGGVIALAPLHIKHSGAASLEVLSLLLLLLALWSFAAFLRRPGGSRTACFALALFGALATRVENAALLAFLPAVAWLLRARARRPTRRDLVAVGVAAALGLAYLPGVVGYLSAIPRWPRATLSPLELLASNLLFWLGGEPALRKIPALALALGLARALRREPRVALIWIGLFGLLSAIYFAHGENLGYALDPGHPGPWGERSRGHDMFRFDVPLLAPVAYVAGHGLAAAGSWLAEGARALLRAGPGRAAAAARALALVAALAGLGVAGGEAGSYAPLSFLRSPYNRAYQIEEFRFLRRELAARGPVERFYFLGEPSELTLVGGAEGVSLLADEGPAMPPPGAILYLRSWDAAEPSRRRRLERIVRRLELRELAAERFRGARLALYRVARRRGRAAGGGR